MLRLYPKSATVEGEVLVDGENVFDMKWNRMRAVRWGEASVVFQGALHSLNPIQRIGKQLAEPILLHEKGVTEAPRARRSASCSSRWAFPRGMRTLPAPAVRRPEAAGDDRAWRWPATLGLLCDEPTTALDVMVQAQMLDLLKGIARDLDGHGHHQPRPVRAGVHL